jgi:hypothetical protein
LNRGKKGYGFTICDTTGAVGYLYYTSGGDAYAGFFTCGRSDDSDLSGNHPDPRDDPDFHPQDHLGSDGVDYISTVDDQYGAKLYQSAIRNDPGSGALIFPLMLINLFTLIKSFGKTFINITESFSIRKV